MRHLELHILQSFPVACLNRDELNSPKTAIFGGVQRARVSSQSWKRAIREQAKEHLPNMAGQRTKLIVGDLAKRLKTIKMDENVAQTLAELAAKSISKLDTKKDSEGYLKVKTLCFLSNLELSAVAEGLAELGEDANSILQAESENKALKEKEKETSDDDEKAKIKKEAKGIEKKKDKLCKDLEKKINKNVKAAIKGVQLKDASDIALFGRMVADDHSLTVEAASMFSHAISTHKVDNELDFFAAVDDLQPKEEAGAAMTGTLEFNSATYYRFAALNLDMLADTDHLGALSQKERKEIVESFIRVTLEAVPGMTKSDSGRKNSMNAYTRPGYVLGIVRHEGHPIQLVNAFEKPLRSKGKGLFELSKEALEKEYEQMKDTWDLDEDEKAVIPQDNVNEFVERLVKHVI